MTLDIKKSFLTVAFLCATVHLSGQSFCLKTTMAANLYSSIVTNATNFSNWPVLQQKRNRVGFAYGLELNYEIGKSKFNCVLSYNRFILENVRSFTNIQGGWFSYRDYERFPRLHIKTQFNEIGIGYSYALINFKRGSVAIDNGLLIAFRESSNFKGDLEIVQDIKFPNGQYPPFLYYSHNARALEVKSMVTRMYAGVSYNLKFKNNFCLTFFGRFIYSFSNLNTYSTDFSLTRGPSTPIVSDGKYQSNLTGHQITSGVSLGYVFKN